MTENTPNRMTDWMESHRPRERLWQLGPEALSDEELLAILFRTGVRGCNAFELSRRFVQALRNEEISTETITGNMLEERSDFDDKEKGATSLFRLWTMDRRALEQFVARHKKELPGLGDDKLATLLAALEFGARVFHPPQKTLEKPLLRASVVAQLMFSKAARYAQEGFWVLYLDRRHVLMYEPELITLGVGSQTLIDAQTLFRRAVMLDAKHLILVHNHPARDVRPSDADIEVTMRLIAAGRVIGIPVQDHIIIGRPDTSPSYFSMRANETCVF